MALELTIPITTPSPGDWAERITRAWQQTREGVIFVGQLLIDAKAELEYGEWQAMIDSELPFTPSTAQRLMKVAGDTRLTDPAHAQLLPPSWATLYELTKLDDGTLNHAFTKGLIKPDMERKDAERLRTATRRDERLARAEMLAANNPPPVSMLGAASYDVVNPQGFEPGIGTIVLDGVPAPAPRRYVIGYIDPPWRHEAWSERGEEKSPGNHYPTMTYAELAALPVRDVFGPNAALFMWATVPHLRIALALMEEYGFDYRSHQCWHKTTADDETARSHGHWFIGAHELLLIGIRGDMPAPLQGTQDLSLISAPRGRHSEKPARFREMIDRYFPGVSKIELFARYEPGKSPEGWDCWGNEAGQQAGRTAGEDPGASEGSDD